MQHNSNTAIHPLAVLPKAKTLRRYTLAEYLHKESRTEARHEYENGTINKLPMATYQHNIIANNVAYELERIFRASNQDYQVLSQSQSVYLPQLNVVRYPDLLVVCETPEFFDTNDVLLLNPVLVVEILSKSTGKYDQTLKFEEYATLDSFREYVLIDQNKYAIETRYREEPDLWRHRKWQSLSDTVSLLSLNCAIEMSLIYRKIDLSGV